MELFESELWIMFECCPETGINMSQNCDNYMIYLKEPSICIKLSVCGSKMSQFRDINVPKLGLKFREQNVSG